MTQLPHTNRVGVISRILCCNRFQPKSILQHGFWLAGGTETMLENWSAPVAIFTVNRVGNASAYNVCNIMLSRTLLGRIWPVIRWRQMETFFALQALCGGEPTRHCWIPFTKASELWCFIWFAPDQTVERTSGDGCRWFESPSSSLYRHCNDITLSTYVLEMVVYKGMPFSLKHVVYKFIALLYFRWEKWNIWTWPWPWNVTATIKFRRFTSHFLRESVGHSHHKCCNATIFYFVIGEMFLCI